MAESLIGFPHSFCRPILELSRGSERAEDVEKDMPDSPDAVDVVVLDRERDAVETEVEISAMGGGGTESRMV